MCEDRQLFSIIQHVRLMLVTRSCRFRWQVTNRNRQQCTGRVLCLDGGGIKGLVMTQMLFVIQKVLGKPIRECFDWISGTSTGGFLALMLCSGESEL